MEQTTGLNKNHPIFITKEFIWRWKQLILNCRMDHSDSQTYGDLPVEIVKRPDDTNPARRMGEVVPGYTFDDCDPIWSNCLNQVVTWHSNTVMMTLAFLTVNRSTSDSTFVTEGCSAL
ncbi:MAG: hypothetical protein VX677_06305 [Candidatus Poribacteria bacterium]|nr:hypothetical protein [Candidatus Poribacteria bacterium]